MRLGDGATLPEGTDLVVTAPGWQPGKPLFAAAEAAGVPVWGDVELAWRLRDLDGREPAPWLAVTGTNGKTTTVQMLASILKAAGLRTAAVGNIGVSLLDAVLGEEKYDVLAVELSSYQLHWAPSLRAHSAVVLNLAPDHLDWHGSMEAYAADKGRVYEGNRVACVYNVADKATEDLVREADVEEGCRAIGFTRRARALPTRRRRRHPGRPRLRREPAEERAGAGRGLRRPAARPAQHRQRPCRGGPGTRLRGARPGRTGRAAGLHPDAHRIAHIADVDEVAYVDDSKATNTHAAEASLAAYESIVWIAAWARQGRDLRRAGRQVG